MYIEEQLLNVKLFGRGLAWLDTGTWDSMTEASQFVHTIEKRQGLKIARLEEIAWRKGWIATQQVIKEANPVGKTPYGEYLHMIVSQQGSASGE